jgi:hypothetical protein
MKGDKSFTIADEKYPPFPKIWRMRCGSVCISGTIQDYFDTLSRVVSMIVSCGACVGRHNVAGWYSGVRWVDKECEIRGRTCVDAGRRARISER